MTDKKIIELLSAHPLFAEIPEKEIEGVVNYSAKLSFFSAGDTIYSPKSQFRALGFIIKGRAVVFSSDTAKDVILRTLNSGDSFGIANLFRPQKIYISRICAKNACTVLFIEASKMKELLETNMQIMHNYIGFLSDRISFLNLKIRFFTAGSAERKLALYLASLSTRDNEVMLENSIASLSDMLDIGRSSLYRAFERLEKDGFIKKQGRLIILKNIEKMINEYN